MRVCPRGLAVGGFLLVFAAGVAGAQPLLEGDPAAGKNKAAVCAACHGPAGNSSNPVWPKLAGQHATYLYRQLQLFASGQRQNPIMQAQVANLSDQDMRDLAVYFAAQTMSPGVASKKLVERGSQLYRVGDAEAGIPPCAGCHGPAGQGNAAAGYPKISGQHAKYIAAALKAYRAGERGDYPAGEIMQAVAANMQDEDIRALASYIQGLARVEP